MDLSDTEAVSALHAAAGYEFKFPDIASPLIETAIAVVDELDRPIAAVVAKRAPEVIMAMRKSDHPLVKLRALTLIHEALRKELTALGYSEANCFLPPELERNYGRHLQRIFGWQAAWKAFTLRDSNG
jgi:hypothetical protein